MDDLISRQAAIDALAKELKGVFVEYRDIAEKLIGKLPSVQQWIPVSERLPDENDPFYVLCCDNYGEMMIGHVFNSDDSDTGYSAESEECYMYNVVAWMPLPEPYKGE